MLRGDRQRRRLAIIATIVVLAIIAAFALASLGTHGR
jgi:hypothetical protein